MTEPEKPKFRKGIDLMRRFDSRDVLESLPVGRETETTRFLNEEMRYEFRRSEAGIVQRIEEAAEQMAADLFGWADNALDRFYESVRVPELNPAGTVATDANGRVVWKRDPDTGQFLEDWRRLDGMDVEAAIMDLQRVIVRASDEVARLHGRTAMAQAVKDDEYWEAYRAVIDGTVNDRTASAHRATRDSRYFYFYTYLLWNRANQRLEAVKAVKRDLEFMRSRLIKDPALNDRRTP